MQNNFLWYIVLMCFCINGCKKEAPVSSPTSTLQESDTTSHEFNWQIDTIGTYQSYLRDVWGSDSNNVYAVGFIYRSGPLPPVNIIRWDGMSWKAVDYLQGDLSSIFGFGPSDIWTVGFWQLDNNFYPLIAHWNGIQWQTWKIQDYSRVSSIWGTSSSNMYACGGNGLILHYDGTSWSKMASNTDHDLRKIWGVSTDEIYAVGYSQKDFSATILKYNGTIWKPLFTKQFQNDIPSGDIFGLWAEKTQQFYIDQYIGYDSSWSKFGWPIDNTLIDDIYGDGQNNIFAVGSFNLIVHFNGKSWWRYNQFYSKPNGGRLYGGFVIDKNTFIVGKSENARGIVYRGKMKM